MATILIVGKNSYIGNHIDKWLSARGHQVCQLDTLTEEWKTYDYSPFDAIVYVAGIVHQPDCMDWKLYKTVNTDMPIIIATRYKNAKKLIKGGKCFYVYFSTMGVYGISKHLYTNIVDEHTPLMPTSIYGKSKLMAEQGLSQLQDETFDVTFIRPPSVYGKGCRGNYITRFTSIIRWLPIIPRAYQNSRQSFIYIDNLCECVRIIIDQHLSGIFCPQDDEIPNANELFKAIAVGIGCKYHDSRILGIMMKAVSFIPLVQKVYGGIEYSRSVSNIPGFSYVVVPFKEGIRRTVSID